MASLYIKDEEANRLAERLASARGLTKTAAVKLALRHELDRNPVSASRRSVRAIIEEFWAERGGLPPATGLVADKAFIDSLYED